MKFFRGLSLVVIPAYFFVLSMCPALVAQQPPAGQPPAQPQQQTPPATPPKASPFETIPTAPQTTPPPAAPTAAPAAPPAAQPGQQRPQLETPKEAPAPALNPNGQVIESFEFRGAKRVPQDTLKALIISKPGDVYNEETLRRDFMILWNTGRFDDIRLETEPGRTGLIVRFVVTERRVIRSIEYPGAKSRHRLRNSGPLQGTQGRPQRGIAVRSQQDPARLRGPQGIPRRARPPVRHRRSADRADSALLPQSHLQGQRRPQGEGRATSISPATPRRTTAGSSATMKNLEGHRRPALAFSSKTCSPRPSTAPSSKRTRSASARPIRMPATSRPRPWKRPSTSSTAAARAGGCR